jgi:quercetin dioxygenase-like cupin family protein
MHKGLGAVLFAAVTLATAQPGKVLEITEESHHRLVLQNQRVRVFQVEVAPHQSIPLHHHRYDYAYVVIGRSEISNEVQGKAPADIKLQDGETRFSPGNFLHTVRDVGDTPFRNVTVEFLPAKQSHASSSPWADSRGLQILEGGTQDILFVKDGVRVSDVQLNRGASLPKDRAAAALLIVAVNDVALSLHGAGQHGRTQKMKAGGVQWVQGSVPVVNAATEAARFITFEFH